ncbi:sensor histidine kinase [Paenibacillus alba]|uniref:sensor histidine kinase n=1 Tax=Paenibacillus alba TaxID=1197127 RepID=UPI001FE31A47|nr:sensor histidine kinase [Paenibacillus alba]NQX71827.1 sensor histidine kinase [Paenibacillus alba]
MIATSRLSEFYFIFFRSRLFNQILLIFSGITIVTFCSMAVLVYKYSTNSLLQKELGSQRQAVDSVTRYLDRQSDQSQEIVFQLYQNQTLLNDMLFFLRNDVQLYIQNRFNKYIASNSSVDTNVETFMRTQLEHDSDILQIALYSRKMSFMFTMNKDKTQNLRMLKDESQAVAEAVNILRLEKMSSAHTLGIASILGLSKTGAYTFAQDLNDPDTLQTDGVLLVTYQPDSIRRVLDMSGEELMGHSLVLFPNGQVIYDSTHRYDGSKYPYAEQLIASSGFSRLDEKSYTSIVRSAKSNVLISGIVPLSELEHRYSHFRNKVIAITGIGIVLTIIFSYMAMYRYSKRTREIVKAMKLAQHGNLAVRVPTGRNDELDDISRSFNRMCEELMSHIDQVYVADIKQKQAELIAFQAQINPHFLYNTLEAIRMSALKNGADVAGEMLYLLGMLFRYAVKPETSVTLEEETDYCRQFLELYRVRYKDKIDYRITIEDGFRKFRVFKLLLQPLVENAIVHGIRTARAGNIIAIHAFADEASSSLVVEVSDNGAGIKPERLRSLQDMLAGQGKANAPSSSLGLRNVHERIRLIYGERYGLEIASRPNEGTLVRARLPYEGGIFHA